MVDGAISAYGRCFVDSTRADAVDLLPIIKSFGLDAERVHDEALKWRHRHIAHRLESEWEHIDVKLYWPENKAGSVGIRATLTSTLGPDDEFADKLGKHCVELANYIWENELTPTKSRYIDDSKNAQRLETIRQYRAKPPEPASDARSDVIIATLSI